MSSQGGSSENMDPSKQDSTDQPESHEAEEEKQTKNQQNQQQPQRSVGATPFKSFDMKQLSTEMKRLADSGKLFNVMREVERRGGLRGLQAFCASHGRGNGNGGAAGRRGNRGGRRGGNRDEPKAEAAESSLDEPSTSGMNNY